MKSGGSEKSKRRFSSIWRNVGRSNPYARVHISAFTLYPIATTLSYEGAQYGFDNPRLYLATLISGVVMLGAYLLLMLPFAKVPGLQRSATGKTLVVIFVYLLKSAAVVLVIADGAPEAFDLWLQRAPGDATIVLISWIALAAASTTNQDYRVSLQLLQEAEQALAIQKERRIGAAKTADRKLRALAMNTLQRELDQILDALKHAKVARDAWRISAEIKNLIEEKIRPLSKELISKLDLLSEMTVQPVSLKTRPEGRKYFSPRLDSRFGLAFLAASLNVIVTIFQHSSLEVAGTVFAVSMSFPFIAITTSRLWLKRVRTGLSVALIYLVVTSTLSYLPTLWIINRFTSTYPGLEILQLTAFLVYLFMAVGFSLWAAFQRGRTEHLASIEERQLEIRRELALIDQEVWLAKRGWAYRIHGSVQGALSVAGSRLVIDPDPSPEVISRVLKDIELAKSSLTQRGEIRKTSAELCRDIETAWRDVCEISFDVSEQASQALDASEAARACFNELAKELVSNAFRHGKAQHVWIQANLNQVSDLELLAKNDGVALPVSAAEGMGHEMFTELTSEWKIVSRAPATIKLVLPVRMSVV